MFDREHILVFFGKFRVVSVCFDFFRNSSVCFSCFDIGSKHRNKPKHNRNRSCFGLFRFEPKILFRGHPSSGSSLFSGITVHDNDNGLKVEKPSSNVDKTFINMH